MGEGEGGGTCLEPKDVGLEELLGFLEGLDLLVGGGPVVLALSRGGPLPVIHTAHREISRHVRDPD